MLHATDCEHECDKEADCKGVLVRYPSQSAPTPSTPTGSCLLLTATTPFALYNLDAPSTPILPGPMPFFAGAQQSDFSVDLAVAPAGSAQSFFLAATAVANSISETVCGTSPYRDFHPDDRSSGGCGLDLPNCAELCSQVCEGTGCFLSRARNSVSPIVSHAHMHTHTLTLTQSQKM